MFAQPIWTRHSKRLAILLSVVAAGLYIYCAVAFWNAYPASYVWSELLISYEGGFVRRGLIGELAYLIHPLISAQALLTVLLTATYIAVAVRVIVLACGHLNFPSLLFAVSPAALLFPLNDPGAFGRKDILVIAAFLLSLALVKRVSHPTVAFGLILLAYIPVGLTHEAGLLYLPAAVAFLLHTSGREQSRRWVLGVLATTAIYLFVAVVLSIVFKGDDALESRMVAAWQAYVPAMFKPRLAADYLSEGFLSMLQSVVVQTIAVVTMLGFFIGAFLGGVPVVVYAIDRPPALSNDPLRRRALKYAVGAMLISFVIAADWGRFIYLFWMHAFIFLASIGTTRTAPPDPFPTHRTNLKMFLYGAALLLLYATTWRMAHSVLRTNPFWAGYIFDVQPLFRFGFAHMYPLEN